jgi:hypothetical protein
VWRIEIQEATAESPMMDPSLERAFFEDVARAEDLATEICRAGLSGEFGVLGAEHAAAFARLAAALERPEQEDALAAVVGSIAHLVVHSILVTLDGGTSSAEHPQGPVRLVDAAGGEARGGLHEWYVDHLFETGRTA